MTHDDYKHMPTQHIMSYTINMCVWYSINRQYWRASPAYFLQTTRAQHSERLTDLRINIIARVHSGDRLRTLVEASNIPQPDNAAFLCTGPFKPCTV